MNTISYKDFEEFCHNSEILRWKDGLPSTLRHDINLISKVWNRKKRPSTDWFWPYHRRFCKNARKLISHGVAAPDVKHTCRVSGTNIHIVTYEELPGMTLKRVLMEHEEMLDIGGLAEFLAHLHNRGIYFRALHLGNVLRLDSGNFGLIDVTDVRFFIFALNRNLRARNLSRLMFYKKHRRILGTHYEALVREYCARIKLDAGSYGSFSEKIQAHLEAHLAARQSNRKHRRGLTALSNREHDTKE